MPEIVLTSTDELRDYVEEDANEFNPPKFIKCGEDWSSDDDSSAPLPPLLKCGNSDEETCSEASIELKIKTKVRRNMAILSHGKTWGSLCESGKEFDALESSTETQSHEDEGTN